MRPGWAVWLLSAGGVALSLCGVAALSVVVALGAGPSQRSTVFQSV